jgi:hypothetical protein
MLFLLFGGAEAILKRLAGQHLGSLCASQRARTALRPRSVRYSESADALLPACETGQSRPGQHRGSSESVWFQMVSCTHYTMYDMCVKPGQAASIPSAEARGFTRPLIRVSLLPPASVALACPCAWNVIRTAITALLAELITSGQSPLQKSERESPRDSSGG